MLINESVKNVEYLKDLHNLNWLIFLNVHSTNLLEKARRYKCINIKEFEFTCLEDIKNAVDDMELDICYYDDEAIISSDDKVYLKRYTQDVVNALDKLKSWIDDLETEE